MRWTIKEDKLIAAALVRSNNEKTTAFQNVANDLGVSKRAVESRYYRNKDDIDKFAGSLQSLNAYFEQVGTAGDIYTIKKKIPWYIKLWDSVRSIFVLLKTLIIK